VTVDGSNTGLGGGQDNGESSDVAQQHGTTPGTVSAVFPRLGYAMADETNITRYTIQIHTIAINFRNHNL
jgi:hypothetical protein